MADPIGDVGGSIVKGTEMAGIGCKISVAISMTIGSTQNTKLSTQITNKLLNLTSEDSFGV